MLERLLRRMRELGFWGLSVGLPLNACFHFLPERVTQSQDNPGLRNLSLPAGLVRQADLLAGWELLMGLRAGEPIGPGFEPDVERMDPTTTEMDPSGQPFPVHVYGQVTEGDSMMYCFLDTRSRRWFRLYPGDADDPSGIRLSTGPAGDVLVVEVSSGRQFRIQEGRRVLVPISTREVGREEE